MDMRLSAATLAALLLAIASLKPALADEGMWTTDDFPADKVKQSYDFKPDQAWLDHVRLSSLRLARGCSASFVSPYGLVQQIIIVRMGASSSCRPKPMTWSPPAFTPKNYETSASAPMSKPTS